MKFSTYQFLTESFKLLLENEGKNIRRAEKYIETAFSELIGKKAPDGTDITPRYLTQQIRNEIPNSRIQGCKFLLGTARIYHDAFYEDREHFQEIAQELNEYLKIIGTAHADEYDFNLNGDAFKDIKGRFEGVRQQNLAADKAKIENANYKRNTRYEIVKIEDFKQASQYGKYTSWCVTHYDSMLDNYTHGGSGRFYFCLRDDYKTIEKEKGENCPLDEYGKSMIAISVNSDGSLNTCTCRWNHDNGGNDNIMDTKQISELLGVDFYKTFIPKQFSEVLESYKDFKAQQDEFAKKYNLLRYVFSVQKKGNTIIAEYVKNRNIRDAFYSADAFSIYFKVDDNNNYVNAFLRLGGDDGEIFYSSKDNECLDADLQKLKGKKQIGLLNGFLVDSKTDNFTRKFNAVHATDNKYRNTDVYLIFSEDETAINKVYLKVYSSHYAENSFYDSATAIIEKKSIDQPNYDAISNARLVDLYDADGNKFDTNDTYKMFSVCLKFAGKSIVEDDAFSKSKNLIKTKEIANTNYFGFFGLKNAYYKLVKVEKLNDVIHNIDPEYGIYKNNNILKTTYIVKLTNDNSKFEAYTLDGNKIESGIHLFLAKNINSLIKPTVFAKKFNLITLRITSRDYEYYAVNSTNETPILKFKQRGNNNKIVAVDGSATYTADGNLISQEKIIDFDPQQISQYRVGQRIGILYKKKQTRWIVINKNDDGSIVIMPEHALGSAYYDKPDDTTKEITWKNSKIREFLNSNAFISKFEKTFVDCIQNTNVKTENYTTTDKFWLLSTNEVGYKPSSRKHCYKLDLPHDSAKQFEYFSKNGDTAKIIETSYKTPTPTSWLLRTTAKMKGGGTIVYACAIGPDGKPAMVYPRNDLIHIAPACTLQAKAK